ncbi:Protein CBG04530 [Caenorhabditis briggsae]|uniref:Protein CBG04530 n=1 Tax=Caenorhabditis briggsae TaxID=6238 RepID=A8WXN7_CAEBR|nr:Protein CBG04530 [Caenorhabditis briggsae]CAP25170.2 Protein CBG04530 [Caenorhabditis briggsae]
MDSKSPEEKASANSTQTDDVTKTDSLSTLFDSGAPVQANTEEIFVEIGYERAEKAKATVGTSSPNDQASEESLFQKDLKQVMETTEKEEQVGVQDKIEDVELLNPVGRDVDKVISKETESLEPTANDEITSKCDSGSPKGDSREVVVPRSEGSISPASPSLVHEDHTKELLDETKERMEDQDVVGEVVDEEQKVLNEAARLNPIGHFVVSEKIPDSVDKLIEKIKKDRASRGNKTEDIGTEKSAGKDLVFENQFSSTDGLSLQSGENLAEKNLEEVMESAETQDQVAVYVPDKTEDIEMKKSVAKGGSIILWSTVVSMEDLLENIGHSGESEESGESLVEKIADGTNMSKEAKDEQVETDDQVFDYLSSEANDHEGNLEIPEKLQAKDDEFDGGSIVEKVETGNEEKEETVKSSAEDVAPISELLSPVAHENVKQDSPQSEERSESPRSSGKSSRSPDAQVEEDADRNSSVGSHGSEIQKHTVPILEQGDDAPAEGSKEQSNEGTVEPNEKVYELMEPSSDHEAQIQKKVQEIGTLLIPAENDDSEPSSTSPDSKSPVYNEPIQILDQIPTANMMEDIGTKKSVSEDQELKDPVSMEDLLEDIGKSGESVEPEKKLAEKIADGTNMSEKAKDKQMEVDNQVLDHLALEANDHTVTRTGFTKEIGAISELPPQVNDESIRIPAMDIVDAINEHPQQNSPPARERSESTTSADESSSSPDDQLEEDADRNSSVGNHGSEIQKDHIQVMEECDDAHAGGFKEQSEKGTEEPNDDDSENVEMDEKSVKEGIEGQSRKLVDPEERVVETIADGVNVPVEKTGEQMETDDQVLDQLASEANDNEAKLEKEDVGVDDKIVESTASEDNKKTVSQPVIAISSSALDPHMENGGDFTEKMDASHEEKEDTVSRTGPPENVGPISELSSTDNKPIQMDTVDGINEDIKIGSPPANERSESSISSDQSPCSSDGQLKEDADKNSPVVSHDSEKQKDCILIMEQCDDATVEKSEEANDKIHKLMEPSSDHQVQAQKEEKVVGTSSIPSANVTEPSPTSSESNYPVYNESFQIFGRMDEADGINEDVKRDSPAAKNLNDAVKVPILSETSSPVSDRSDSDATISLEDIDISVEGEKLESPSSSDPILLPNADSKEDADVNLPANSGDTQEPEEHPIVEQCDDALESGMSSIPPAKNAEPSPTLSESKLPLDNDSFEIFGHMNTADGINEDVKRDYPQAKNLEDVGKIPTLSETSSPVNDASKDSDTTRSPEDMDKSVEGERLYSPCPLDPAPPKMTGLKTDADLDAQAGNLHSEIQKETREQCTDAVEEEAKEPNNEETEEPSSDVCQDAEIPEQIVDVDDRVVKEREPPAKKAKIVIPDPTPETMRAMMEEEGSKEPRSKDSQHVETEEKPDHKAEKQKESGGTDTLSTSTENDVEKAQKVLIPHHSSKTSPSVGEEQAPDCQLAVVPEQVAPQLETQEKRGNEVPAPLLQDESMDTTKPSSSAAANRKTARQEESADEREPPAKKTKIEIQKPRAETMAVMKKAIEMSLLYDHPEEALLKALGKFGGDTTFMAKEIKKVVVIGFDPVSLRMLNGVENFLNLKALPHASISFEAIAEATCHPPVIEGEVLTEQPIKLSPIEYSGFVLGKKGKEISKLDSATTQFLFVLSSDSEGLVLGPMPPLPTKKGMLFSKGMETDLASEEQRRVIRRRLASTETSQLAQYVKKGRCHMIVASHTDERKDPTVGEVLEALEATPFNTEVLEMLRKNPTVLPNCSFVDRVLPVCEDFYHRVTSMLKPKDYKKLFIELDGFDEVTVVDNLAAIIQRNFKANQLLKGYRTSKPSQGVALFFYKKQENGDMMERMHVLFSKLRKGNVVGAFAILTVGANKDFNRCGIFLTSSELHSQNTANIDEDDAAKFWEEFNDGKNVMTGVKDDCDSQSFIFLVLDPVN